MGGFVQVSHSYGRRVAKRTRLDCLIPLDCSVTIVERINARVYLRFVPVQNCLVHIVGVNTVNPFFNRVNPVREANQGIIFIFSPTSCYSSSNYLNKDY